MSFRPLHDRVLVRRVTAEEKTAGGIIIPDVGLFRGALGCPASTVNLGSRRVPGIGGPAGPRGPLRVARVYDAEAVPGPR
jgi:hypothetical protein